MKKKIFAFLKNGGLFIILLGITLYVLLNKFNLQDLINACKGINYLWVVLGFCLMLIFQACEAYNIQNCLDLVGIKTSYLKCLKYAIVGYFFSSITPSSSGGQPMQVYYMYKDDIKVSHSSLALLLELTSYLIITILLAIGGFIYTKDLIINSIGNIKILLIIGTSFNIFLLLLIITCIFFKKASSWLINLALKIIKVFKIKNEEEIKKYLNDTLAEFQTSASYVKNNKSKFLKILFISLIQVVAMHSVTFFIYKSFNLNVYNYFTILSLQALLYISVSSLPFPGAVGISESAFMLLFKIMYVDTILPSAMILTRTVSFYLCVIFNGLILSILYFKDKNKVINTINNN